MMGGWRREKYRGLAVMGCGPSDYRVHGLLGAPTATSLAVQKPLSHGLDRRVDSIRRNVEHRLWSALAWKPQVPQTNTACGGMPCMCNHRHYRFAVCRLG